MKFFPLRVEKGCKIDKRPEAKCPPTFEMSIYDEYGYNIYVKKPSEKMANSSATSPTPTPQTKCSTGFGKLPGAIQIHIHVINILSFF